MKLVGMERLAPSLDETPESAWIIPSSLTADQLKESLNLINKAEFDPPTFEDGQLAEDQLRRKTAPRVPRKKAAFDDDDGLDDDDDEMLFPAGGPTARKADHSDADKPKKIRRRDRKVKELTEEEKDEQARKRREKEKEKARRFKSEVYVHASDDETDEEYDREFFAKEARLREKQKTATKGATMTILPPSPKLPASKRKAAALLDSDDSSDEDNDDDLGDKQKGRTNDDELVLTQESVSSRNLDKVVEDEGDNSDNFDDTPPSSSPRASSITSGKAKRRRLSKEPNATQPEAEPAVIDQDMADADDEDIPASKPARRRPRAKAGFIIDSSDEE
jgi:replication fork protection complex subunit Tof1/Swi1